MSLTIMDVYLRSLLFLETVTMTTEYQSPMLQLTTRPLQLVTTGSGNQEDDGNYTHFGTNYLTRL